jgi:alpha-galactosidase
MFGVLGDRHQRSAILAGFLSQLQHFGSLETRLSAERSTLRLWANGDQTCLNPGAVLDTDWACIQFLGLDEPDPLATYLEAVARQHGLTGQAFLEADSPTGWCSWYQYSSPQYTGTVTPEDLVSNLEALVAFPSRLPLQVFQIDDGFESKVGDWSSFAPAFPEGVSGLAAQIREAGKIPGLWLAPFIIHPKSRLANEHPDWLLRGSFGRLANAGFFWNSFAAALDLTHPEALDYAAGVVHCAAHEWGFRYLKLDFLYAAAIPGQRRDFTRTRAQVLRRGLEALRQAAGEGVYLLGCGCPLGSAIGLVDAMRIGTDTHWTWNPEINGMQALVRNEPDLPAVRNACQNTLTRASLHRRWWINDPDCLLLRKETLLTDAEVQTAATVIALTGGSFMLSDDLSSLPPERLRIAQALLPLIGETPRVLDWFDARTPSRLRLDLRSAAGSWHLLGIINWSDEPQDMTVNLREFGLDPQETYLVSEFWSQKRQLMRRGKLLRERIAAHGTLLFAVRNHQHTAPVYAGSNLHISQGLEIKHWASESNRLMLILERPGPAQGNLALNLPGQPKKALINGQPLPWEKRQEEIYAFSLQFDCRADVELSW